MEEGYPLGEGSPPSQKRPGEEMKRERINLYEGVLGGEEELLLGYKVNNNFFQKDEQISGGEMGEKEKQKYVCTINRGGAGFSRW